MVSQPLWQPIDPIPSFNPLLHWDSRSTVYVCLFQTYWCQCCFSTTKVLCIDQTHLHWHHIPPFCSIFSNWKNKMIPFCAGNMLHTFFHYLITSRSSKNSSLGCHGSSAYNSLDHRIFSLYDSNVLFWFLSANTRYETYCFICNNF